LQKYPKQKWVSASATHGTHKTAKKPWIDIARQIAGDAGVACLGTAAKSTPPGTEVIGKLFQAAGGVVLVLFDEVLNYLNRHRAMADSFHAFIQNLTVATTGTTRAAALISLPRSQVEMSESDQQWQDRITKTGIKGSTEIKGSSMELASCATGLDALIDCVF
jgi:hypothetical protein